MKIYMLRTVPLPIIMSFFTVHTAMVYVIQVCWQLSSRIRMEYSDPARKLSPNMYDIQHCCVYGENLLMINRCPKYVEFYFKNKFEKLLHLVGFIIEILYLCSEQTYLRKDILNQKYSKYVYEIRFIIILNGLGMSWYICALRDEFLTWPVSWLCSTQCHLGLQKRDQSLEDEHDVQGWAHHDVSIWIMKHDHDTATLTA
jgi:hypothetical protein